MKEYYIEYTEYTLEWEKCGMCAVCEAGGTAPPSNIECWCVHCRNCGFGAIEHAHGMQPALRYCDGYEPATEDDKDRVFVRSTCGCCKGNGYTVKERALLPKLRTMDAKETIVGTLKTMICQIEGHAWIIEEEADKSFCLYCDKEKNL